MTITKPAGLTLVVPETERRVYAVARRLLARKMGPETPELGDLIRHELRHREPRLIAEEYLDATGWCRRQSEAPCPRRGRAKAGTEAGFGLKAPAKPGNN